MTSNYEGKGILFRNDRKPASSKQPDYRGRMTVAGADYEIGGWIRQGKNGEFISLSIQPADANGRSQARTGTPDAPF